MTINPEYNKILAEALKKMDEEGVRVIYPDNCWISVKDRLPEEGKWVLVWYEYFAYGDVNKMVQTYGLSYQYNGFWSGDVQGTRAKCLFWMPLPDAPIGSRRRYDQT